jgi:tetratricopeptide (TPR) repeat protein
VGLLSIALTLSFFNTSAYLPVLFAPPVLGQEGAGTGGSWDSMIQMGNKRYQDGDFAGALDAYEVVIQAGFESADLHYNLGNAYFKVGDLGRSILSYERALRLRPRDPDARANLELARSLTADDIEPLPRFWVLSAASWWTKLLPWGALTLTVTLAYLLGAAGLCARILSRHPGAVTIGTWLLVGSGSSLLLFGSTLLAREGTLGGTDWGVIMVEEVSVQSAPSHEDNLTLFRVHEGTKVRLDQRTDLWSEIVLEDGKVGWVTSDVLEII